MVNITPRISVILPFYNAESTINKAIKSIADQTENDFECILVDNNSTDMSREIANSWVEKDQRFHLVNEVEQGVVFASNTGANLARGQYISRMDADDYAHPDKLKKQSEFLDNNSEYDCVSCMVEYVGHKSETMGFQRYVEWSNAIITFDEIYLNRFVEFPVVNPTLMWRKEIGEKYGLYNKGNFPEDYELFLRWISNGIKYYKIPEFLLKWFDSDFRLTRTDSIYSDEAFFKIKTKFLANWLTQSNPHHPNVLVWGASKISRKRAELLSKFGVSIIGYVDIKDTRELNKEVLFYKNLPDPSECFILVYLKEIEARKRTKKFLIEKKGYTEGLNFLMVS